MITDFRSMVTRYRLVAVAVAALAAPVGLVVTAGSASAHAPCGTGGPNRDGQNVVQTAGWSGWIRSGSSTNCGGGGAASGGDALTYHCYTVATNGSTWTYLSNHSNQQTGWVADAYLPPNSAGGRGSAVHCGF